MYIFQNQKRENKDNTIESNSKVDAVANNGKVNAIDVEKNGHKEDKNNCYVHNVKTTNDKVVDKTTNTKPTQQTIRKVKPWMRLRRKNKK